MITDAWLCTSLSDDHICILSCGAVLLLQQTRVPTKSSWGEKGSHHQPSNYQCMHMQFIISLTIESALSRRKCKPVFKLMYAACIELLSCMMQLPPLSIDEVRALRLKLRQERKQQQQQQREAMATHDQQSTTTQYRTWDILTIKHLIVIIFQLQPHWNNNIIVIKVDKDNMWPNNIMRK